MSRQALTDTSYLAQVDIGTPSSSPTDIDRMLMFISISGSANLQHRIRQLCHEYSDIFSPTVRDSPALVPPMSMTVDSDRWRHAAFYFQTMMASIVLAGLLYITV